MKCEIEKWKKMRENSKNIWWLSPSRGPANLVTDRRQLEYEQNQ